MNSTKAQSKSHRVLSWSIARQSNDDFGRGYGHCHFRGHPRKQALQRFIFTASRALTSFANLLWTPRRPHPCPQRAVVACADDLGPVKCDGEDDAVVPPEGHRALPRGEVCHGDGSVGVAGHHLSELRFTRAERWCLLPAFIILRYGRICK